MDPASVPLVSLTKPEHRFGCLAYFFRVRAPIFYHLARNTDEDS